MGWKVGLRVRGWQVTWYRSRSSLSFSSMVEVQEGPGVEEVWRRCKEWRRCEERRWVASNAYPYHPVVRHRF